MKAPKIEIQKFTGVADQAAGGIDIARIVKRPQVRSQLGDLSELVESIKDIGVKSPIQVHAEPDGSYRLIAGERRVEAAKLAGLTRIPAVINRNLSELEIRKIQVSENNDRKDLPAYDQAKGVWEDVEKHGFQEAVSIWNRTEAWVSKRMAVKKYHDEVLALLLDDLCGDLEVLNSLNQLYGKSEREFKALVERLRSGHPVTRDDVRGRLAAVKEWDKLSKARSPAQPAAAAAGSAPASDHVEEAAESGAHVEKPSKAGTKAAAAPAPKSAAKGQRAESAQKGGAQDRSGGDRKLERERHALVGLREMLFDYGQNSKAHVASLQQRMLDLQYDPTEAEWVMWSGFLTVTLPMLEALGSDRGFAYLRRLQQAVKSGDPAQLWAELHPVREGEDPEDEGASRVPVPERPADWTF